MRSLVPFSVAAVVTAAVLTGVRANASAIQYWYVGVYSCRSETATYLSGQWVNFGDSTVDIDCAVPNGDSFSAQYYEEAWADVSLKAGSATAFLCVTPYTGGSAYCGSSATTSTPGAWALSPPTGWITSSTYQYDYPFIAVQLSSGEAGGEFNALQGVGVAIP
jgi:hypothetical protein